MTRIHLLSAVAAFVLLAGFGLAGGPVALGAHPFWGVKVAVIGGASGAGASLLLRGWRGMMAALAVLLGAGLAAHFGKAVFVASYAENALAGRFWFLGWIVACAGAAALLAQAGVAVSARRRTPQPRQ